MQLNIIWKPTKPFCTNYGENGHFLLSGKKTPRNGGFILCKAKNRQEVETIIREDPFDKDQLAFYEIVEFEPFYFDRALASFLEK